MSSSKYVGDDSTKLFKQKPYTKKKSNNKVLKSQNNEGKHQHNPHHYPYYPHYANQAQHQHFQYHQQQYYPQHFIQPQPQYFMSDAELMMQNFPLPPRDQQQLGATGGTSTDYKIVVDDTDLECSNQNNEKEEKALSSLLDPNLSSVDPDLSSKLDFYQLRVSAILNQHFRRKQNQSMR